MHDVSPPHGNRPPYLHMLFAIMAMFMLGYGVEVAGNIARQVCSHEEQSTDGDYIDEGGEAAWHEDLRLHLFLCHHGTMKGRYRERAGKGVGREGYKRKLSSKSHSFRAKMFNKKPQKYPPRKK